MTDDRGESVRGLPTVVYRCDACAAPAMMICLNRLHAPQVLQVRLTEQLPQKSKLPLGSLPLLLSSVLVEDSVTFRGCHAQKFRNSRRLTESKATGSEKMAR